MTIMVAQLILCNFLILAVLAQLMPRPMLEQQPVVARRVYRVRNGSNPLQ